MSQLESHRVKSSHDLCKFKVLNEETYFIFYTDFSMFPNPKWTTLSNTLGISLELLMMYELWKWMWICYSRNCVTFHIDLEPSFK